MGRKTFVLDTNVLLHDPDAIQKFGDNEVVMPLVVLEELDKLKKFTDELGKNARQIIRFIDSLEGDLFKGVTLENGAFFSIFTEKKEMQRGDFPFTLDSNRHRILFAAYLLSLAGKEVVILISKDFVLRVKAEAIGIEARDYAIVKDSFDQLYTGIKRVGVEKAKIDEFLVQGGLKLPGTQFFPNEYCLLSSKERSTAIGKYNQYKDQIESLVGMNQDVWGIRPLNDEQQCALDLLMRDEVQLVSLIGQAGTGKTLLALTCGLRKVFDEGVYNRILISRPIMPLGKDIGYLPGTKEEKMYHWMRPIYDNLEFVCGSSAGGSNKKETRDWILESEKIEMEAVTFIRGRSLARTYIIIDEAQNLTPHEIKTIISRAGQGTKVILTGDPTQIDNPYLDKDSNALTYVVGKFKPHALYGHIFFERTERSKLAALAAEIL